MTYGSLGTVIILLIWFYFSSLMLLLGTEVDSVIDEVAGKARLRDMAHFDLLGRPLDDRLAS